MIGVIADDITGSNDIGVMFGKSGYIADIHSYDANILDQMPLPKPDVLIFDTDSRLDASGLAYDKVFQATRDIQKAGAVQFFNKTCSVFRGNIGAEFDAMLDALGEPFAIVVLGFPENGRQTFDSIHYVHGKKLEKSEFQHDPVHPMTQSNLVHILQSQTRRKVGAIQHKVINKGWKALKREIETIKKKQDYQYVILDVTDQKDLYEIAQAVHEEKVICGSSAIAEEIPKVRRQAGNKKGSLPLPDALEEKGLFCAAGSLTTQTYEQIEYMNKSGNEVMELNTLALLVSRNKSDMIDKLVMQAVDKLNKGVNVVLHSSNTLEKVKATKVEGSKHGWSNTEVSRFISETIAHIAFRVMTETGQHRFVIAGGDTSAAVCRAFHIRGMRVWKEIQPGLPSCLSLTEPPYLLVLKSGSFGTTNFIEHAFEHLREETAGEKIK